MCGVQRTPAAVTDDGKLEALKRFSQVLDIVSRYYVRDVPTSDLVNGALKGMLQNLDPHSTLMTREEFKEMQESTSGEFFGIGIEITSDNNQLMVVTPIDDTPAYKAGLKPGDIIMKINDEHTHGMTLQDAVTRIRGPKGSEIELTVLHRNAKEPTVARMKRDVIPLISVKSRCLEPGYYWIRITRFSEKTTDELHAALKKARAESADGIKGIVLDLRYNPGGLLDQAVSVSDAFLSDGAIVSMRGRLDDSVREFHARKQSSDVTAPMVVLVNAGSASASEIVAGALGDRRRALILGEQTFGKGSVQNVVPLSDGSGMKLTIALYYTPSGRSIQAEGISPDIVVPFESPRAEENSAQSLMVREKDLNRHIENGGGRADGEKNRNDDAAQALSLDNQLRMALQVVKTLPRMQSLR